MSIKNISALCLTFSKESVSSHITMEVFTGTRKTIVKGGKRRFFMEGVSPEVRLEKLLEFSRQTREEGQLGGERNMSRGTDADMSKKTIVQYSQHLHQQSSNILLLGIYMCLSVKNR